LSVKSWLNNFEEQKEEKRDEFLIYILDLDEIKIYRTKTLTKKGVKISLNSLNSFKYSELSTKQDKEIIQLLQTTNSKLKDEIGIVILDKLIKTKRFFNTKLEPFLVYEKEVEVFLIKNEKYLLKTNIFGEVIQTNPPLEIRENKLYKLLSKLTFEQIINLLNAPEIDVEDIVAVYKTLRSKVKITPPEEYKVERLEAIPKPKLTLQANKYIQLTFIYDKYEIKPYPFEEVAIKERLNGEVEIIRNNTFERNIINEIKDYGFKDLENTFIAEDILSWKRFLEDIEFLRDNGYQIEFLDFDMEFNEESEIEVESENENNWFSLSFEVKIGKKRYPLLPIIVPILKNIESLDELSDEVTLEYDKNKYITFKTEEIKPILSTIFELMDNLNKDRLKIAPFEAHLLDFDENVKWKGKKELLKLSQKLKNFDGIKEVNPPKGLTIELRDYQKFGLNWLMFLRDFKFGGILADDMGLGKTIQTLSLLLKLKEQRKLKKPVLLIVPTSLLGNWKAEIEKSAPALKYISIYGNERGAQFREMMKYDIIFTTYNLIVRDFEIYQKEEFEYIILDEAQKIKNPNTKSTQVIKKLNGNYKLALSGTPIENHLGELWSIFSFVMPGFLGSLKTFRQAFINPIEKERDFAKKELLNKKIKPFVLRRTKEKVLDELPEKMEIIKYAEFDEKEVKLYESIRVIMDKKVRDAIAKNGIAKSQILVLDALLKLRQICCHPKLLKVEEAQKINSSSKLDMFLELVDELLSEGRKILVFSQFTSMIDIIKEEFEKIGVKYSTLTGSTKNRDEVIDEFKSGKSDIFLISLKAGGVGLNLTEADTVIHYDPWWNKAAQNQATDRAYRIGQDKNVFVYKLVVRNTIEEKIIELQNKKSQLAEIFEGGDVKAEELLELLK